MAINDLTAKQIGDGVLLSFTVPNKSTLGERLTQTPTMEVYRGALRRDGTPDLKSFKQVDTLPGPVLKSYMKQGKVEFLDAVPAEEAQAHPGELVVYSVKTRASERKISADSNLAQVNLYPVPERIGAVDAQVTEKSVELKWTAPVKMSGGGMVLPIEQYHVYRGELDPASAADAEKDLHAAVWKLPLLQIAAANEPAYEDKGFDYGKTYVYVVRSVVREEGVTRESGDSKPAIVTPKDVFPPAAPRDVVAAVLQGPAAGGSVVDLSWSLNVETDLAGYRIYRSESEGSRGQLLTPEPLPTPAYRDASTQSGHKYWYTVTAVDQAGNESGSGPAAVVEIP
ncbi:MAG TPA: fibronectin type III domain-containing protein [Dongiaceae bacterium]|nr:fibronectin type III domain-containing protein [Dongiaceae bacterium]